VDNRDSNALAELGHEPIETDVRAVWRTGAALVGVVAAALLLTAGMMKWLDDAEGDRVAETSATADLNRAGRIPLAQLRDQQQRWLDSHAWVDRDAGIARVPIDRAMETISQNGLPEALTAPAGADKTTAVQPDVQDNPSTDSEGSEP
jgi:hypothetical protein